MTAKEPLVGPREWAGLAVLALPTALLGLDVTLLYLALPELAADLRPSGTQTLWIMDAYGFLVAGSLVTMGTLGDRVGRRRLLVIGAFAFGAVSVVAAFATSAEMLIAARAALGVAGATLMPSTLALVSTMFRDARQRALAIGVWATMFALGMALGPLVGGLLLTRFWWGSAFLVAVPVVALVVLTAPVLLPEHRAPRSGRFDLVSVALSLAAMLPVTYGLKRLAADGPGLVALASVMIGVFLAVLFVRRQRASADPLLDVRLFGCREFSAALGILLVGLVGVGGAMYLVTQYLQLVAGLPPVVAGAWMGPPALLMLAAAIAAPLVARRIRPGYVVATTLAVSTGGYAVLALVEGTREVPAVVAGFGLVYLGLGALAALGTDLVVGAAPRAMAGAASALSETVQELGLAVGVAALGSVAAVVYRTHTGGEVSATLTAAGKDAFVSGMNVAAAVAGVAVACLAGISAAALRHVSAIGAADGTVA